MVLDADGLAVLKEILSPFGNQAELTPHPGEFAGLFGIKVEELQSDRIIGKNGGTQLRVVCVEGHVCGGGAEGSVALNATGNPGMATAGGDVLAGLIERCWRGLSSFEAACTGVWLHGRAGDLAAAAGLKFPCVQEI